ncbi:dioxygenase [Dietzia natronolimnaea]|uniref:dioxygenase family protein n=2 Tax=Bacteria TaxID=2 RepID=UPI00306A70D3
MFTYRRSRAVDTPDPAVHEHDLGLGHDLAVMNRRAALRGILGAAGVGAVGLTVGCATDPTRADTTAGATTTASDGSSGASVGECVEAAPGETAGPYPGDGSNGPNVLIESGVHRSDITPSFGGMTGTAEGVPMRLTVDLQDLTRDCAPGAGMAVYLWHCDREGRYSLYSEGVTDQNYLRGVQTADESGRVEFTSVFPACYSGRWPHLHFEVYDTLASAVAGENARLTSQIALPADVSDAVYAHDPGYSASVRNMAGVSLESDTVFSDGWDAQMPEVVGSPADGYRVAITIGVAAAEDNAAGGAGGPGGSPPGDAGMPGGPPPGRGGEAPPSP